MQLRGGPSPNLPELRETLSLVLDGQPVLIVHVSLPLPKVLAQLVGSCPSRHCRSRRLVPGGQVGDCDGFPHVCGRGVCRPVARLPPLVVHEARFGLKKRRWAGLVCYWERALLLVGWPFRTEGSLPRRGDGSGVQYLGKASGSLLCPRRDPSLVREDGWLAGWVAASGQTRDEAIRKGGGGR